MTIEAGIENAGAYIDTLDDTYPAGGDDLVEGDNHIRGIKNCIINSFPSIAGAVTATHTELNLLDGATVTTAEINYNDITTLGTVEASKTVTADASRDVTNLNSVTSTTFVGDLTGNADTSTALAASRDFSITGDITASAIGFTGDGDVALNASIDAGAVNTAELADFAVTGIKLNTMTAGSEKISYWQGAALQAVGVFPAYNKIVECRAGQTGTVTVGRTHDSATMYTAIYKNGSLAVAGVTGAGAKLSNVAVVEGDLIQIYGNCSTDGCSGDTISDIWVGVTNGIGVIGDWYA